MLLLPGLNLISVRATNATATNLKLTFQMVLQSNITHTPHELQVFFFFLFMVSIRCWRAEETAAKPCFGSGKKEKKKTNQRNSSTSSATEFKLCLLWLHSSDGESCCCYCCMSCCCCRYCFVSLLLLFATVHWWKMRVNQWNLWSTLQSLQRGSWHGI